MGSFYLRDGITCNLGLAFIEVGMHTLTMYVCTYLPVTHRTRTCYGAWKEIIFINLINRHVHSFIQTTLPLRPCAILCMQSGHVLGHAALLAESLPAELAAKGLEFGVHNFMSLEFACDRECFVARLTLQRVLGWVS